MMTGDDDDSDKETATYHLWKTNLSLPDATRRRFTRVTQLYSKRWRIEWSYRALRKSLTSTTSTSHQL
jgi:hypothetical protein